MYNEYRPCDLLSPFIHRFWEFNGNITKGMHFNILPDGCTDIIFTLGDVANACGDDIRLRPYNTYFIGPMSQYSELIADSDTINMLGIRFHPCGLSSYISIPLNELRNKRILFSDIEELFDNSVSEILCEKKNIREKIDFLEKLLIKRYYKRGNEIDRKILLAVKEIDSSYGTLSINKLSDSINMCQRHLERKFKMYTGFSPKEYSRIIQFKRTIDLLSGTEYDNLLSVAVQAGYYDVAHLSREVKKLSGSSPTSFISSPQPLDESLAYYGL